MAKAGIGKGKKKRVSHHCLDDIVSKVVKKQTAKEQSSSAWDRTRNLPVASGMYEKPCNSRTRYQLRHRGLMVFDDDFSVGSNYIPQIDTLESAKEAAKKHK